MKLMFMCLGAFESNRWWVSHTFSAYAEITNIAVMNLVIPFIELLLAKKTLFVGVMRDFTFKWLEWVLGMGNVVCFTTIHMDDKLFAVLTSKMQEFQVYALRAHFADSPFNLNVVRRIITDEFELMLVSVGISRKNKWN